MLATVDLINNYLIDRIDRILLEFAVYLVNSLYINYLCSIFNSHSQTIAIAIWAKYLLTMYRACKNSVVAWLSTVGREH